MARRRTTYIIATTVLTAMLAALSPHLLSGNQAWAEPVGARVKTPHEVFDFGIIPQQCEVSHSFWLHSTGDEELVISKLIPNCGCTEAPLEKSRVMPGDSTRAEIIFGSGRFDGPVKKYTQIKSNSTGRAPALTFTARVMSDSALPGPIVLKPSAVRLDDVRLEKMGEVYQQTVTLTNTGSRPVTVGMIDQPYANVVVDGFDSISLGAGDSHELTLTFAANLPELVFSQSITFDISDETQDRVTLPIFKKSAWDQMGDAGK